MQCETIIAGQFVKMVKPIIDEAKHTIDICVFDWRWYPNEPGAACQIFNQAIVSAIRRGVKVRAIVNSEAIGQHLRAVGAQVKHHVSAHLLHLKMMIIDADTVVTGSHNYTQSAFQANYELSVVLREMNGEQSFEKFFNQLWT